MTETLIPYRHVPAMLAGPARLQMSPLTGRDRAILRAVATGTAELVAGAVPDLLLDGRWCCDQPAAHRLARAGLIAPARAVRAGHRVAAVLTAAGTTAVAS